MTYEEARALVKRHEPYAHLVIGMLHDDLNGDMANAESIWTYSDEVSARVVVDGQNIIESTENDDGLLLYYLVRGA